MSDHVIIDNTCPDIVLWQQYQQSEPIVNFFAFLKDYWQSKYFDKMFTTYAAALTSYGAMTDYVQFYAKYVLGIIRPIDISEQTRYDSGFHYDDSETYDNAPAAKAIMPGYFATIIGAIINWKNHEWNVEYLYKLIHDCSGLGYDDIAIEQDDTDLDYFIITLASTDQSMLFTSIFYNYSYIWNLPFGIRFDIILV